MQTPNARPLALGCCALFSVSDLTTSFDGALSGKYDAGGSEDGAGRRRNGAGRRVRTKH
jgi:hypothetical protein